jgi:hypothetical protein
VRRCDFCGGKLGLVVHRKWGWRFCRLACKMDDESRRRDEVQRRRRCGVPTIYGKVRLVLSVAAALSAGSAALAMAQHPAHDAAPSLQAHVPISADAGNRVAPEPGRSAQMRAVYFEPTAGPFDAYTYSASVQLSASSANRTLQGEFRFPLFKAAPNVSVQIISSISAVPMRVSALRMSEIVGPSGPTETKIVVEAQPLFEVSASGFYFANLVVTGVPVTAPSASSSASSKSLLMP